MRLFQAGAAPWGPDDTNYTPQKIDPKDDTQRICSTSFFLVSPARLGYCKPQVTSWVKWFFLSKNFHASKTGGFRMPRISQGYVAVILATRWYFILRNVGQSCQHGANPDECVCIVFGGWQLKDGPFFFLFEITGWVRVLKSFCFQPYLGKCSNLTNILKWVETTDQSRMDRFFLF